MTAIDFDSLAKQILPDAVQKLLLEVGSLAHRKQIPVYLVGGVVRDLILGAPNLDIDLVVQGDGLSVARELAKDLRAALGTYKPFLTATLTLPDGRRVDVATARAEKYAEPAALPQVEPATIEDDLRRRDFTINSLALRIRKGGVGELLDPFGGSEDIGKGVIRVLHRRSFTDDPTRIFRAVRYQVRFGFRIDGLTLRLLRKAVSNAMIERLSGERIRNELWLIFEEEKVAEALSLLARLGVLSHVHPSLEFSPEMRSILRDMRSLSSDLRGKLKADPHLASLFSFLERAPFDRAIEIGKRLSLKRKELEKITQLKLSLRRMAELSRKRLKPSQVSSRLRGLSPEFLLFTLARAEKELVRQRIKKFINSYCTVRPEIGGKDLQALGIREGPLYQEILSKVLDAKLDGFVKTKEEEISLVRRLLKT